MKKIKVIINNKNYDSWTYYDAESYDEYIMKNNINPGLLKLFSEDVFTIDNNNNIVIVHSVIRSYKNIAGVLLLNKTYGRKNQDKLYYKCIPHDKRLPEFLIPINIKKDNISFNKQKENRYITFSFKNWDEKHPEGILCQTIGETNNLINFFEYQLYSKNLNISLNKFSKNISYQLKHNTNIYYIDDIFKKYQNIENRQNYNIITIDPKNCQDFDDAFSLNKISESKYIISVYISNVAILLDYFNLWTSFSERVATIYLPDRKRPMLPIILSDNLCSLKSNESRFAICMDLIFENDILINIEYKNTLIKVTKNLTYEDADLKKNDLYNDLFDISKKISKKYKYLSELKDSHDLVSYYMLFMNNKVAEFQEQFKNGIYRSVKEGKEPNLPSNLDDNISSFFKIFHSISGQYSTFEYRSKHNYLHGADMTYLHITSPIRRLVDLLNIIIFQKNLDKIKLSKDSELFYNNWLAKLDYINTTMRAIKKVQNNCDLLYKCNIDKNILNNKYKGYIFDKLIRNDGLYYYSVYLVDLNIISKIIIKDDYDNYSKFDFILYYFASEHDIKKKIRIKIAE